MHGSESSQFCYIQENGLVINPDYLFLMQLQMVLFLFPVLLWTGLVEIKCPYSHKYKPIECAADDKSFCLKVDSRQHLHLDHTQIFLPGSDAIICL